jgi:hypothetical protein
MSASLIGHSGSSTFRLSTYAVSMSLAGSCFSSESAPGPKIDHTGHFHSSLNSGRTEDIAVGPEAELPVICAGRHFIV